MQSLGNTVPSLLGHAPVGQASRSQSEVFELLYNTFLILGTIVGVIVVSYTLYNVYKYRSSDEPEGEYDVAERDNEGDEYDVVRPEQGVIPTGQGKGGGRKLFLSFSLSAILVLGLIIFSYTLLLEVENPDPDWEVEVTGEQYRWTYEYPAEDGLNTSDEEWSNPDPSQYEYLDADDYLDPGQDEIQNPALVMPESHVTGFTVTSRDVWHNFGIPEMRAKSDAIPDEETQTWAMPEEPGIYEANCYELCGAGHSNMRGPVIVLETEDFAEWYIQFDSVSQSDLEFLDLSEEQRQSIVAEHRQNVNTDQQEGNDE